MVRCKVFKHFHRIFQKRDDPKSPFLPINQWNHHNTLRYHRRWYTNRYHRNQFDYLLLLRILGGAIIISFGIGSILFYRRRYSLDYLKIIPFIFLANDSHWCCLRDLVSSLS